MTTRYRLFLASAVVAITLSSCGSSEDGETSVVVSNGPSAYWHGTASAFCRGNWSNVLQEGRSDDGRLVLNRAETMPGSVIRTRIANESGQVLQQGMNPLVDMRVDGEWVARPIMDGRSVRSYPALAIRVNPGKAGPCLEIPVPDQWRPGQYRVRFEVRALKRGGGATDLILENYFDVDGR